jgi:5-methyltetrahydrofolate corrinoid/iron sulfur protein methyltransferase
MYKLGENIHIISPSVKKGIAERDGAFFVDLARAQKDAGADCLDLNIGPQKKEGVEIVEWLVDVMQEAVPGMTLSFDTTNLAAIEAGLKKVGSNGFVNSTSGEAERLEKVPPVAAEYGAKLIALCMEKGGIPVSADARIGIALSGCQEYVPESIETVRMLKMVADPAPMTTIGLSNVSNAVPHEMRSLFERVYVVMLLAAGIDSAIVNPLDQVLMNVIETVENRDDSTAVGALYLKLFDAVAAMEELQPEQVDMSDPEQAEIWKTLQVLLNKVIYTDSYLRL